MNIYDPKGVSMSPALEKLSPVKARLQQLTGCECVDISKVVEKAVGLLIGNTYLIGPVGLFLTARPRVCH